MKFIPELNPHWPATWHVLTEDDVISPGEVKWFRHALKKLAGMNPFQQPILRLVWGPTHRDEMSTTDQLKYVDFQPERHEPLGERRWFVEIWRSPEFLARSGRYQLTTRQDEHTGEKLLKSLSAEGCYDYWLRLERITTYNGVPQIGYQPPDREALGMVEKLWKFEQMSLNERNALEDARREEARRAALNEQRNEQNRLWGSERDYVRSPYISRPPEPLIIIPA